MNGEKVLSIIIPTYNAEPFLDKCLTSFIVSEQEIFEKLQIIVVNDGSPDKSSEIAEKYAERYPNVYELINKENGGHGSGINVGVEHVLGKYFKVIDADDWVDTKEFQKFVRKLMECEADAVISDYRTYDIQTDEEILYKASLGDDDRCYNLSDIMEQWLQATWGMTFHGITYRTDFYRKQNYRLAEKVFYEDQEYATVPMSRARTVFFTGLCVYVYRIGDVNQSVAGQNQVKRMSHLENVIYKVLEQENHKNEMAEGGVDYWKKKTAMIVTSYYQIALLKNKDRKSGRERVRNLNQRLQQEGQDVYEMVKRKSQCFVVMSCLHVSNRFYEKYAPEFIKLKRKLTRSV